MRRILIILLTALSTVHTLAAPTSTNRVRPSASTSPSRVLPQFQQPPSSNGKPRDTPLNLRIPIDPLLVVGEYLSAELGLDESDYFVSASYAHPQTCRVA
ncbi:hypothetical protein BJ742DRAFT_429544 [Cladochytrium replicatum]|nr:hypothetical protein BJ742DRAFT_429544 [Cladochytrium replicatum]